ncbi:hypothetical protein BDF20DRAFT_810162, partial [Mycotypha africana]|uniref:uncharacterized protein n=1 Tax=Mycotypha africana TaxID=64632 RepID=UPI002301F84D
SVIILVLLVAEAIAIVIMESFIIFYHSAMFSQCQLTLVAIGLSQVDLIYHGLFAITPIYQILLYLDALHQRNTIHILILILFGKSQYHFPLRQYSLKMLAIIRNETSSTIYFKDTFDELISNMKPFEYACLVFVPVCFLFMVAGIIFLYRSFKWNTLTYHLQRYPDGDSSSSYKNALIAWSTFTSLLKLDFFFLLAYSVQLIPSATVGYEVPAFEGVLIFCLSLIMLSIAMYSARTENMKSLSFFCLASIGFIGYFGYRLFTFGIHREGTTGDPYAFTRYNLVYATLTVILLMIMTLATSLICI